MQRVKKCNVSTKTNATCQKNAHVFKGKRSLLIPDLMSHVNTCARQHVLSSNALVHRLTGETAHQASGTLEAERASQPGTLIKRPTRPAVWQLMKPDQSPAAPGKAPQDLPLTTVQVALAPGTGGVDDLIGGRLHPTTPAGKEAHPAMPVPERSLLASVRHSP